MKSILLFRHGKSDWNANYKKDHDRPLSKRGVKAAKLMGLYLLNIQQIPDLIISSTALRAKTTAQIAKKFGQWNSELILDNNIYSSEKEMPLVGIVKYSDGTVNEGDLVGSDEFDSIAESANDSTRAIDVLSNGFKLRTSNITINNTNTYVFGAWGDVPFKYNNVHAQS